MQTAVIDKESLVQKLTAHRKNIRAFGVKQLSLFGSFITGNVHQDSDIDLLVDFEVDKKTYDNFIELSFYLEELLGRKVELVTRQSISRYIGPYISKQAEHVAI